MEFFFSAWIVVNREIEVPRMVKRLMVNISFPVIDRVSRCIVPDMNYFLTFE